MDGADRKGIFERQLSADGHSFNHTMTMVNRGDIFAHYFKRTTNKHILQRVLVLYRICIL